MTQRSASAHTARTESFIITHRAVFFVNFSFLLYGDVILYLRASESVSHSVAVEQTMRGLGGRSSAHAVTAASYPPVLKVYSSGSGSGRVRVRQGE